MPDSGKYRNPPPKFAGWEVFTLVTQAVDGTGVLRESEAYLFGFLSISHGPGHLPEGSARGQMRARGPPRNGVIMWVLGTELGSSGRAVSPLFDF